MKRIEILVQWLTRPLRKMMSATGIAFSLSQTKARPIRDIKSRGKNASAREGG